MKVPKAEEACLDYHCLDYPKIYIGSSNMQFPRSSVGLHITSLCTFSAPKNLPQDPELVQKGRCEFSPVSRAVPSVFPRK